jgi:hypothetical protein
MAGHFRTVETWRGVPAFAAVVVFLQAFVLELFLELERAFPAAPP